MSCSVAYHNVDGYRVKEYSGSTFVRIFSHDSKNNNYFKEREVIFVNKKRKFSVVGSINEAFKINDKYEFLQEYCEVSKIYHWKQDTNPLENISNFNYEPISIATTFFGGLAISSSPNSAKIAGHNVGWYYAIGEYTKFGAGLAGPAWIDSVLKFDNVTKVELWIKIKDTNMIRYLPILYICSKNRNACHFKFLINICVFLIS